MKKNIGQKRARGVLLRQRLLVLSGEHRRVSFMGLNLLSFKTSDGDYSKVPFTAIFIASKYLSAREALSLSAGLTDLMGRTRSNSQVSLWLITTL